MTEPRAYLFVTLEGGGNVPPVLGVARRLAARGHRVRVLTEPCLREVVEAAGASFLAFRRHFTRSDRREDLIRDAEARTPTGALRRSLDRVVFGPAAIVAEETWAAIQADRPDVVVVDVLMPGALIAAEAAGIPRVVLFHMPEYFPGPGRPAAGLGLLPRGDWLGGVRDRVLNGLFHAQLRRYLPGVNAARTHFGLAPLGSAPELLGMYHAADLRLIQTCREFDFPMQPPPANVRYVGPVLDDPDWSGAWVSPWAADDARPLVVVSLSSTYQNQRPLLERISAALGTLEVRGLVTLGPAMSGEALAVPPNVVAVPSAPHAQVFRHAAAVVTHAGHGTVMRALAAGLPLLCLPMGRDQPDNAARVVASGAGLRLSASAPAGRIAAAVRRLLAEPRFRGEAQRLGAVIRRDVAGERAVRELEALGAAQPASPGVAVPVAG